MFLKLSILLFFLNIICSLYSQNISIEQNLVQIPVLKNKDFSPVLQFKVSSTNAADIRKVWIDFEESTDIKDINAVFLIDMGKDSTWNTRNGKIIEQKSPKRKITVFSISESLLTRNRYFIVAVGLSDSAPLNHQISAGIRKVSFKNEKSIRIHEKPGIKQRIGIALRQAGDDGAKRYRIPGLAQTNKKSLLAIYDIRWEGGRDLQGDIDIGVSRSIDGGFSWDPMRTALDMGEYGGLPQKFNGVSDACILVDKNSNSIFVAGCWMHGVIDAKTGLPVQNLNADSTNWNHQWRRNGSLQGFSIDSTSQFLISKSTDDGLTWSKPINITKQIKKQDWHLFAPAPGSGITSDDGTLVFPTQGKDKNQNPFSNITFSKDGGKTWTSGKPSFTNTTENMVVQLNDGSIMQNMRDNRNNTNKSESNGRAIFTTDDLGETWQQHPTHHGALIEPVCMASLYKHEYIDKSGQQKSILLFSNPSSKFKRERMTIKVSFDDGLTWPEEHWLLLDEIGLMGGYSSITSISNNTIGILYEGSQAQMTFERINLEELGVSDAKNFK